MGGQLPRPCSDREDACLAPGSWGSRWTNDSALRMFFGGVAGHLDGDGAPRWKQHALYDALKDTVTASGGEARLSRVATHDRMGGLAGRELNGAVPLDVMGIRKLVEARTA